MKQFIRKTLSIALVLVLALSVSVPAFAAEKVEIKQTGSQVPIVRLYGDGTPLVDKNGREMSRFGFIAGNNGQQGSGADMQNIVKSVANVLLPFLIQGLAFDNWDPYYENLQKEMSEIFGDVLLDENGEVSNGSGIKPSLAAETARNTNLDKKGSKGYYSISDYMFWYDWRLDPCVNAEKLHDYIEGIKKATKSSRISIIANCLGTDVVFAYIAKYGKDSLYGVGIDASTSLGSEPFSEAMSGKFEIDGSGIERLLNDLSAHDKFDLNSFLKATISLAEKSGLIDTLDEVTRQTIYEKLVKGVTSALVRGTIMNMPCYWSIVSVEDFDTAMEYVFGPEGSEERKTYAKLIEKIVNYNESVKKKIPSIMESLRDDENVKLGVVSKYGLQLLPICQSRNKIADTIVSVEKSSFGATTGTIYAPLSDEYIAAQTEKGLGKYISPDKQVDASTCIAPDYTWFIKNVPHSVDHVDDAEDKILYTVVSADKQYTINDLNVSQYTISLDGGTTLIDMTEDNCDTEPWKADEEEDHPKTIVERIFTFIKSLLNWFKEAFKIISSKLPSLSK